MQHIHRYTSRSTHSVFSFLLFSFGLPLLCAPLALAQAIHFSGAQTTVSQSLTQPTRVAEDTKGDIFVTDVAAAALYEEIPNGSGYRQVTIPTSTLLKPYGVTVDPSGNVFVADSGHNRILREAPVAGGYQESVLPTSTLNSPNCVFADAAGNVFVCDMNDGRVLRETPSGSGAYVETVVDTQMRSPTAIAEDAAGNLYVADVNASFVYMETLGGTGYTRSTVATGKLRNPTGVVVDAESNLYIGNLGTNQVLKETLKGTTYTQSVIASSNLNRPDGIALDGAGNLFIVDTWNHRVVRQQLPGAEYGAVAVGTTGTAAPMESAVFTFDAAGTVPTAPVVTRQGQQGLDFAAENSGTCVAGQAFAAGASCTVDVSFSPTLVGSISGAAVLQSTAGAMLATGYLHGVGSGPLVSFSPPMETVVGTGLHNPRSIAADAFGNVYIADTDNMRVVKETFSGGGYAQSVLPTSSLQWPLGVAVDGNGNVYVSDTYHSRELKETIAPPASAGATPGAPAESVIVSTGLNYPAGIAVDGAGNFYLADSENNRVLMETPTGNGYTASTLPFTGLSNLYGVAVDGAGSLYLADSGNNRILKETYASGTYTQSVIPTSTLAFPRAVAVDANGDIFIADTNNGRVLEESLQNGVYAESVVRSGLASPDCLTLDGSGNLYITDTANQRVLKETFAPPALQFASTTVGSSSASQLVTLTNIGNAPLGFPTPASGSNPAISTGFSFDPTIGSACPSVSAGHDPGVDLAPGESCTLSVSFAPVSAGAQQGDLVLSDTSLNAASALQSIALAGTATGDVVHLTLSAPASATYGNPVQVIAQLSNSSNQGSVHSGSVAFSDQSSQFGTQAVANAQATQSYLASAAGTVALHASFTPTDPSMDSASGQTTMQVLPAPLNIQAANATRAYGAPNPVFTGSVIGAVNTDSFHEVFATSATPASPVAGYAITPSVTGSGLSNYSQNIQAGTLQVTPAALTATANSATRAYGAANPRFTGTVAGTVNGDVVTESFTTVATPASPVATYAIVPALSGAAMGNYVAALTNGTLTVTKAALSIAANNATRTYGAANPQFNGTVSGAVNGDVLNETFATTANAASPAATYSIVPSLSGAAAANYNPTVTNGTLTVTQAALTVQASDATRVYGAANPLFTGVLSGAVNGDLLTASFSTTATAASAPGTYAIVPAMQGPAAANYTAHLVNGALHVTPATLTLAVQSQSRMYGAPNPIFTGSITGAANGDSLTESFHTAATQQSPVGSYPITVSASGSALANYAVAAQPATLTITPAPLTVAVASAQRSYGAPNPVFAGAISGAVAGDTLAAAYGTTAGAASQPGQYSIQATVTGAALSNYTLNVSAGVLTILRSGTTTSLANEPIATSAGGQPQLTLQATVVAAQSAAGTALPTSPTGSVRFYAGKQLMGDAPLQQGSATFVTTQFNIGSTNEMTAVYQGDGNFEPSASNDLPVEVSTSGFWIKPMPATAAASTAVAASNGGSASLILTVASGQAGTLPLQAGPGASGIYPGKVTFSVQGLPTGATFSFSPSTLSADSGVQTVTLTVQTAAATSTTTAAATSTTTAAALPLTLKSYAPAVLALVLLPFARARKLRSVARRLAMVSLVLAGFFAGLGLTGCGFTSTAWSKAASTPQAAKPVGYPLTVTMNTGGQQTTLAATLMLQQ